MKIAVVGASGFVGLRLVKKLLDETNYEVVAVSRHAGNLKIIKSHRLTFQKCDIFDTVKLSKTLKNCDVAYYLIHMMAMDSKNFPALELKAANSFCVAATKANLKKVIYLGGLGDDKSQLSKHLKSRHNTGKILGNNLPTVYEFRASIIIGNDSTSFEIIKSIVKKVPIIILPKWAKTLVQPICSSDMLNYLISAINLNISGHRIIDIGGPKIMTYKELLLSYACFKNKRLKIFTIGWLPKWPAKFWLKLFLDKRLYPVALAMIESLDNDVVVVKNSNQQYFGKVLLKNIESEFS